MGTSARHLIPAATLLLLGGCGSASDPTEASTTPEVTSSAEIPAPVILTPENLDGATVPISADRPLVINVPDHPEQWTVGHVDDPRIARFVPGRDDGSATFNPGVSAVAPGQTAVRVTEPGGGRVTTFLVEVSS